MSVCFIFLQNQSLSTPNYYSKLFKQGFEVTAVFFKVIYNLWASKVNFRNTLKLVFLLFAVLSSKYQDSSIFIGTDSPVCDGIQTEICQYPMYESFRLFVNVNVICCRI